MRNATHMVQLRLPEELHRQLTEAAELSDSSMCRVIRQALKDYLANHSETQANHAE